MFKKLMQIFSPKYVTRLSCDCRATVVPFSCECRKPVAVKFRPIYNMKIFDTHMNVI